MSDIDLQRSSTPRSRTIGYLAGGSHKERLQASATTRARSRNEIEGRSQVVSRDVAEAVDSMMPSLMRMFQNVANCRDAAVAGSFEATGATAPAPSRTPSRARWRSRPASLCVPELQAGPHRSLEGRDLGAALANQDYVDLGQLANAGSTQQGLDQQQINDTIQPTTTIKTCRTTILPST